MSKTLKKQKTSQNEDDSITQAPQLSDVLKGIENKKDKKPNKKDQENSLKQSPDKIAEKKPTFMISINLDNEKSNSPKIDEQNLEESRLKFQKKYLQLTASYRQLDEETIKFRDKKIGAQNEINNLNQKLTNSESNPDSK